jgi:hypothetical protein
VEIQKVDYDYTYDRFTHYFIGNLIDMQRNSKDYSFAKEVYIIVVVTAAYRISEKKVKEDGIINALRLNILDKSQIATIFDVSIEYVERIENKEK